MKKRQEEFAQVLGSWICWMEENVICKLFGKSHYKAISSNFLTLLYTGKGCQCRDACIKYHQIGHGSYRDNSHISQGYGFPQYI